MYQAEAMQKVKPISCIITTLAAKAYNGEPDVYSTLKSIIGKMTSFITRNGQTGLYEILNPVMEAENFAEKWASEPQKAIAFFEWMRAVQKDILTEPLRLIGIDGVGDNLKKTLGENVASKAFAEYGRIQNIKVQGGTVRISETTGILSAGGTIKSPAHRNYGK